jgi:peptidoglycan/LPS O-acetylase OafA/YrhL
LTPLRRPWPLVILVSCIAVAVCNWYEVGQPMRSISVFWFFLICPGLAIVGLLDIRDRLAEAVVAIGLSLALGTGVAIIMVLAKTWSPDAGLAVLIGISLLGAALQVGLYRRRRPASEGDAGLRAPVSASSGPRITSGA